MASGNYIGLTFFIFIMAILSSLVTPTDSQVIVCQPWVLCGTVAYKPEKDQYCDDGSVQSLIQCCGSTMYNPYFQHCCTESYKKEYNVVDKIKGGTEITDCQNAKLQ